MQDKEFAAILQDEPQQPLALVPLTEEEQVTAHTSRHFIPNTHTRLPFLIFIFIYLSTEELLHVGEQRGRAEAHG